MHFSIFSQSDEATQRNICYAQKTIQILHVYQILCFLVQACLFYLLVQLVYLKDKGNMTRSCVSGFILIAYYVHFMYCLFFSDFSDRISKSRRVGYESGELEIVSLNELHCYHKLPLNI